MPFEEESESDLRYENEEFDRAFTENQIEEKKNIIIEKIDKLYDEIMLKFNQGNLFVYDSKVFSKITKNKFYFWVISNNPNLQKLFG